MSKGGGGGVDTSGLEKATKQATALQKQIYKQGRADIQPWYNMGVGAVGRLSDLLGISGGSVQSREQVYNQLKPQYTTQSPQSYGGYLVSDDKGNVFDVSTAKGAESLGIHPYTIHSLNKSVTNYDPENVIDFITQNKLGTIVSQGGRPEEIIDYTGLNAAVDQALQDQGVPGDYGSLLQRFGMDQYQEDPGYEFRKQEAQKALERGMAAQGVTLGGGGYGEINPQVARALEEQSQGLASQEYQNAYNRYVNDQLNTFNMLMGSAGMGQQVTGQMLAGGQNYATNVGNLQTGLASAQMNAQLSNASRPSMFGTLLGAGAGALFGNPGLGAAAGKAIFG